MVAFCDIIEERAEKASKEYGVPGAKVYTDYKELLKDESIDAVLVLTPNCSTLRNYRGLHCKRENMSCAKSPWP